MGLTLLMNSIDYLLSKFIEKIKKKNGKKFLVIFDPRGVRPRGASNRGQGSKIKKVLR